MASELENKLERVKKFVKIEKIIDGDKNSPRAIRAYYRINGAAYRRFHSDRGFMHFRVSKGDKIEEDDIFYQPDTVMRYMPQNARVLELGPGQGANIFYLAGKRLDATFIGVDLKPPRKPKTAPKNITFIRGNYADLNMIESESVDLVFGIETVVHCSDKDKVFAEVARVLKPNGVFILYDYVILNAFDAYKPYEQTVINLISKGGASAIIESDAEWDAHFAKAGLEKISKTYLSKEGIPDLHRLALTASRILNSDKRSKLFFKIFPRKFTNNVIIGYFAEDCVKEGLFYYNEWIYRKKQG
ncbi:MAG: methyltransferase domain-containing protein [Clostridia bacterium]|nr:methyltransferase domain-containing protein [Clostridia bacterium]